MTVVPFPASTRSARVATHEASAAPVFSFPGPVDVRALRHRLGLSQIDFAATFRFAVADVRAWERGRSRPDRCVQSYLRIISHDPAMVRAALGSAPSLVVTPYP